MWGDVVAKWSVHWTLGQAVQVGVTVLCSWARHFTLTVPHSPTRSIMGTGKLTGQPDKNTGWLPAMD